MAGAVHSQQEAWTVILTIALYSQSAEDLRSPDVQPPSPEEMLA